MAFGQQFNHHITSCMLHFLLSGVNLCMNALLSKRLYAADAALYGRAWKRVEAAFEANSYLFV